MIHLKNDKKLELVYVLLRISSESSFLVCILRVEMVWVV